MSGQEPSGILLTGFPMKKPEMQIEAPTESPFREVREETDYSRDTQTWD